MSVSFFINHDKYDEPMMNMSNQNAWDFLSLLDEEFNKDLCGRWNQEKKDKILKKAMKLRNSKHYDILVKETVVDKSDSRCTIIDVGRNDSYVIMRLEQIIEMIQQSNFYQADIVYA